MQNSDADLNLESETCQRSGTFREKVRFRTISNRKIIDILEGVTPHLLLAVI